MPRAAREKSKTGIYHIIQRGVNRQTIFEEDEDRKKFIEIIGRYQEVGGQKLFAYCLMDNHFHLLLREADEPVGKLMKRISSSYVNWYNSKYSRCGHLFQERFKSEAVENDGYFLTVLRYIHRNPVKAGIVAAIEDYPWSSYGEYLGASQFVDTEFALSMFGEALQEAVARFRGYSAEDSGDQCLEMEEGRISWADERLREFIRQELGRRGAQFCQAEREQQEEIIRGLKKLQGVTIRQIARITGVTPTRVWKL